MTFGERVRDLRKKRRLSQNALAELAGVSPRTIFGYEAGTTFPRTEKLLTQLADALGVSREALVEGTSSLEAFAFIRADHSRENHARILTQQIVSLMLDEHLPGVCKDEMAQTIMNAYWESRRRNHEENDTTTL